MKRPKKAHLVCSFFFSLLVNFCALCFLALANRPSAEPEKDAEPEKKTLVIRDPKPPKPPKRIVTKRRETRLPTQSRSTIPNLPSRFSSPEFMLSDNPSEGLFGEIGGVVEEMSTDFIFKEEAVDTPPRVIKRVPPKYPWSAEKRGDEGFVIFKLQLSEQGHVQKIWTVESKPPGIFDEEAKKAVRQYRFSPATYKGKPVPVICRQKLVFKLGAE